MILNSRTSCFKKARLQLLQLPLKLKHLLRLQQLSLHNLLRLNPHLKHQHMQLQKQESDRLYLLWLAKLQKKKESTLLKFLEQAQEVE